MISESQTTGDRTQADKRPMRFQFQIKHLMWLVFACAVLFGLAREAPWLVIGALWPVVSTFLMFLMVVPGTAVTCWLQDLWTESCEDRMVRPRIVVWAKTAACVVIGVAASIAMLVFEIAILSAIVFFLSGLI